MASQWLGSAPDNVLETFVPPGGLVVVLISKSSAKPPLRSRLTQVSPAGGDLRATLQALEAVPLWLARSGLSTAQVEQIRLIGTNEAVAAGAVWLAAAPIRLGKAVVLPDSKEAICFYPESGRLRVRISAPASTVDPMAVAAQMSSASAPKKCRVLVVDDSKTICELLSRIVSEDPTLEVVGTVTEPERVEQAIRTLQPHLVTLDIHMGEMSGVDVVRRIFPIFRLPIVMISSLSASDGNYVFDALLAGAVDYIQKPSMRELPVLGPQICEKLRLAVLARASAHGSGNQVARQIRLQEPVDKGSLIAIGSSTGGVEALREVLTAMPEGIPPVVIVQHIPPVFSRSFAERMNTLCAFTVKEAEDGELLEPNKVIIAPGAQQMAIRRSGEALRVEILDAPPVNRHKPSVDFMFDSIAALKRSKVAAAVLTGMGADGAQGLLKLRQTGARTLAQDEASSVVYGMPREAARLGGAEEIVALHQVAETLLKYCKRGTGH